jgi:Asp/Glu/hydantoin racemase
MTTPQRAALANAPRIALVHALAESVTPALEAFRQHWPAARPFNLLDDALSSDRQASAALTPAIADRVMALGRYAAAVGAHDDPVQGLLFTCSAFGPAIRAVKQTLEVPVLGPEDAALEAIVRLAKPTGLLVTFAPSAASLHAGLEELAALRGTALCVKTSGVPGALGALSNGEPERHDALIAEAAAQMTDCEVILLGQFSMARAASSVSEATSLKVLTTPAAAVQGLRTRVLESHADGPADQAPAEQDSD